MLARKKFKMEVLIIPEILKKKKKTVNKTFILRHRWTWIEDWLIATTGFPMNEH